MNPDDAAELDCLGHTPAQAREFESMCRAHDEVVRREFSREIYALIRRYYAMGPTLDDMWRDFDAAIARVEDELQIT